MSFQNVFESSQFYNYENMLKFNLQSGSSRSWTLKTNDLIRNISTLLTDCRTLKKKGKL